MTKYRQTAICSKDLDRCNKEFKQKLKTVFSGDHEKSGKIKFAPGKMKQKQTVLYLLLEVDLQDSMFILDRSYII